MVQITKYCSEADHINVLHIIYLTHHLSNKTVTTQPTWWLLYGYTCGLTDPIAAPNLRNP